MIVRPYDTLISFILAILFSPFPVVVYRADHLQTLSGMNHIGSAAADNNCTVDSFVALISVADIGSAVADACIFAAAKSDFGYRSAVAAVVAVVDDRDTAGCRMIARSMGLPG